MEHLSNDYEDHCNKHENTHKLCNETMHPILSLLKSQWKLKQDIIRIPNGGKEERNPKEKYCESQCQGSK